MLMYGKTNIVKLKNKIKLKKINREIYHVYVRQFVKMSAVLKLIFRSNKI